MRIGRGLPLTAVVGVAALVGAMGMPSWGLDPQVDGVVPHVVPDADISILSGPGSGARGRAGTATPTRVPSPTPASAKASDTAPAGGVEAGPATRAATIPTEGEALAMLQAMTEAGEKAPPLKINFSTPKGAVESYFAAMLSGSRDSMKSCFVVPKDDAEKELLETGMDVQMAAFPVMAALKEKFPADAAKIPDMGKIMAGMVGPAIQKAGEEINGDKATVKPEKQANASGPMTETIKVVKVGNDWKFPIEEGAFLHKVSAEQKAANAAIVEMYAKAVEDVKAGKYASFEEANKDLEAKTQALRAKAGPGKQP
jgi:hypothetical protein